MLAVALDPPADLRAAIGAYADFIHPSRDGHASRRVVAATEALLRGELGRLRRKPWSAWFRRLQSRAEAGYWTP